MSRLEVITGPMFSGKTEELIRRLHRAEIAGRRIKLFRPAIDTRYEKGFVTAHSGNKLVAHEVSSSYEIWDLVTYEGADVIGIDEAQFLDSELEAYIKSMFFYVSKIIISGLDKDFATQNFGSMPRLMVLADKWDKLTSVCNKCGADDASFTQRLVDGKPAAFDGPTILVGGTETYEARCRDCFQAG